MYALFNLIFLPIFYKTACRAGVALLFGGLAVSIYIVGLEAAIQLVPILKTALDTTDPAFQFIQLPILAAGIVIYILAMLLAFRLSASRFARVNL